MTWSAEEVRTELRCAAAETSMYRVNRNDVEPELETVMLAADVDAAKTRKTPWSDHV